MPRLRGFPPRVVGTVVEADPCDAAPWELLARGIEASAGLVAASHKRNKLDRRQPPRLHAKGTCSWSRELVCTLDLCSPVRRHMHMGMGHMHMGLAMDKLAILRILLRQALHQILSPDGEAAATPRGGARGQGEVPPRGPSPSGGTRGPRKSAWPQSFYLCD
ncbi:hypothetical protein PVAP13_8NG074602 [Panicum virgatum]|uniref:Uncharacterized protein n=1 Tax=Panicum virgatum TaxID=38727 RepID=A0A8T0P3Q5_PANVG|nr:hypothetical protein PVAP13_8NG074602 [Panicum virgatum]